MTTAEKNEQSINVNLYRPLTSAGYRVFYEKFTHKIHGNSAKYSLTFVSKYVMLTLYEIFSKGLDGYANSCYDFYRQAEFCPFVAR